MALSSPPEAVPVPRTIDSATDERDIEMLRDLVAIPSLSGQESSAVDYLCSAMEDRGLTASVDAAGSAVGRVGSGPRTIVLLGHIDTVPGEIPVRIEDGVLHGRGTVDAKGPLATFTAAAARAAERTNSTIYVIGAVGEEAMGSPGANEVARSIRPDWCIIGEPSGWDAVCLGYRGTVSFIWRLQQAARHSAGPGESVAERAVGFWNGLVREVAARNGDATGFNSIGLSLRSMRAEGDGLYDDAELSIGVRLPPQVHSDEMLQVIAALASDGTIELNGAQEGYQTAKQSPIIPPFLRAIRAEGGTPRFTKKLGTSDMTVVGPVWSCPIVAYGPGDASLDHTPEERIALSEYLRAIRVLTEVLAS